MAAWPVSTPPQSFPPPWTGLADPFGFDFGLPPGPLGSFYAPGSREGTRRRLEGPAADRAGGGSSAGAGGEESVAREGGARRTREPYTVGSAGWTRSIPVDFIEREDVYVVKADMPGARKGEIHVEVQPGNVLRFGHKHGAEREKEDEEETGVFHRAERISRFRNRNLRMPDDADLEAELAATFEDGVLTVIVPKKKAAEGRAEPRTVEVA